MQRRRSTTRSDRHYKELRARNNDSVKKSREKSRLHRRETLVSIEQLEDENRQLQNSLRLVQDEFEQLQSLFKEHTGMDFDGVTTSKAKPVLTIQTNPETTTESQLELDAKNLDGSIVIINGVQYKIVSVDSSWSNEWACLCLPCDCSISRFTRICPEERRRWTMSKYRQMSIRASFFSINQIDRTRER